MNIITISREFGSGGREVGKRIADLLGYEYYDREIIEAVADKHELDEDYVENVLSKGFSVGFPVTFGRTFSYHDATGQKAIELLSEQCKFIKEVASKGNCVIVGRSSNIILEDYNTFNVFVYADMASKLERCKKRANTDEKMSDFELKRKIKQVDSGRAKHQRFLTDAKWGEKSGYHLCVNTSGVDIKAIAPVIAEYAKAWFENKHE